jgi:hypothetical protein
MMAHEKAENGKTEPRFQKVIAVLDAKSLDRLWQIIEREMTRRKTGSGDDSPGSMTEAEFEKWRTEQFKNADLAAQADVLRRDIRCGKADEYSKGAGRREKGKDDDDERPRAA